MTLFQTFLSFLGLYTATQPALQPRLAPRQEPILPMPMRIRPEAVAKARVGGSNTTPVELYTTRQRTREDVAALSPAKPPPGVLPPNVTPLAMDKALAMDWGEGDWSAGGYGNSFLGEGIRWLGYPYLAELTQRAEYRRIVETMAREMTRRWIKIQVTGQEDKSERVKVIEQEIVKHKLQSKFRRLAELDGFFGRSHLYINTGQDTLDRDLMKSALIQDKRTFKKGMLKGFQVVEPVWTYPGVYNSRDPLAPDFYLPLTWYIFGKEVHRTRFLTFVSREVPDLLKPAYSFGGISLSQLAKPYVDNWLRTRQSVSDITHSFSVMVLLTNMSGVLSGGGGDAEDHGGGVGRVR